MPNSQRFPLTHYLISNVKDIVVFPGFKVFISDNSNIFPAVEMQVILAEKPQLKINSF